MEGTLSLFDWSPAPRVPVGPVSEMPELAEGSGPCVQRDQAPDQRSAAEPAGRSERSRRRVRRGSMDPAGATSATPVAAAQVAAPAGPIPGEPIGEESVAAAPVGEPVTAPAAPVVALQAAPAIAEVVPDARAIELAIAALDGPRVVVFDCETTGTDRLADQVIELCIQRGLGEAAASRTWRIKPAAPIHPGAQAVHGIAQADLEGCPSFVEVADDIAAVFAEADVIVGYNIAFDIDMLQAEYTRIGRPLLDLTAKKIVDAFRLWQQCEPRSLQHAHQRFVGNGFASAHSASADVAATGRVLSGMLRAFNLAGQDWDAIAAKCDPQHAARASWLGPSRHLRWEGEIVVLGFGKHANAPLHQLASGPERSFLRWVVDRDFPVHVGEICRAALDLPGEEFLAWARRRFPPAVASAIAPAIVP